MNYRLHCIIIFLIAGTIRMYGQANHAVDTTKLHLLESVTVEGLKEGPNYLSSIEGVSIYAGKKTNLITLQPGQANLAQNVGRMIFAKIPGLTMWDMDGAGTQMNIGSRGTDSHRSIEMNMRQNGYNTNSDIFGYPENHYTVPMQGVKQIQLVRGSAALQFGSQFGGMMNYVMKDGEGSKPFFIESTQTRGSYNFLNSYNAVGGTKGKVSYYAYYDNRHGDGWRPNAAFNYQAYYGSITYQLSSKGSLAFQMSRMDYRQQIAGGLTDAQFLQNARQSERARNFFSPKINIPAVTFTYDLASSTHLQVISQGLWGERSSVQFINTPNIKDTINTTTRMYNPRQVDRDFYKGFNIEARFLHQYNVGSMQAALSGGIRYSDQRTNRRQKGKGTTASDFDLSLIAPYGIDLKFNTINYAAFVENIFWLNKNLSVTPGVRYEVINSDLSGVIVNATYPVHYKGNRSFPLFGTGVQYQTNSTSQLYGNISQAYRPFLYANITPADQVGVIDPNLKDSKGYDIDAGYRGQIADLINFDVNVFRLYYGNRIGNLTMPGANNSTHLLTTNIGNSVARGVEMYANLSLLKLVAGSVKNFDFRLFSSLSYTHARYVTGRLSSGSDNISLVGNHVENVPDWMERGGLELKHRNISTTLQISYTSHQFSDANNTVFNATGIVGAIRSYKVYDWAFNWAFLGNFHASAGINNIANLHYYSRRINMYPGPGILPADGRTYYIGLGCKF